MTLNGIGGNSGMNPVHNNLGASQVSKFVKTETAQPLFAFNGTNEIGRRSLDGPSSVAGQTAVDVARNKEIANDTNVLLKELGFSYKVTPAQVASVDAGMKNVVQPGMTLAANGAVAANIQNPNGPFADVFLA